MRGKHTAGGQWITLIQQHLEQTRDRMLAVWQSTSERCDQVTMRLVRFCGNGFESEGRRRPSAPTPHATSLSLQAVFQAWRKEGRSAGKIELAAFARSSVESQSKACRAGEDHDNLQREAP